MIKQTIILILFFATDLWARGGGGGGGHGGGGHGGGFSGGHYGGGGGYYGGGGFSSGGDLGFWFVLIVIFVAFYALRKFSEKGPTTFSSAVKAEVEPDIQADFFKNEDPNIFQHKVTIAFLTVQKCWSEKRLDLMRRFITDGVYQRFHAQFTMMNILSESNPMSDVQISDLQIVKATQEADYDCIDIAISASATDQFISEKYPQLNSPGGNENFLEYWSFIRRKDFKRGGNIYSSDNCPKCSAPLTSKLIETARCPYCGTYINNGEYDWVLSEITQQEDYEYKFHDGHSAKIAAEFSQHALEDRASNAFMQILVGQLTKNTNTLKRFCTTKAFEFFQKTIPNVEAAYNRLYTQAVEVLKMKVDGDEVRAFVAIKFAYSIVMLDRPRTTSNAEEDLISDTKVLVLLRLKSDLVAKGSVYAGSCPHCGAAQKDSLLPVCAYCGGALNDAHVDWIVDDMIELNEIPN